MLFPKKVLSILFLIFELLLAVEIQVYRDTSIPNFLKNENSVFLWSGVAKFNHRVTNGQLVQIAEDATKSMYANAVKSVDPAKIPLVMSAMVYNASETEWTVYLASSSKGPRSAIYPWTKPREDKRCGQMRSTVPKSLQDALTDCARNAETKQHVFDAKCGEMNVLLEVAVETGKDPKTIAASPDSRIVAWQGNFNEKNEYVGGRIKGPCNAPGEFGCRETLQAFTEGLKALSTRTEKRSYAQNKPVSMEFVPLFPNYATPGQGGRS